MASEKPEPTAGELAPTLKVKRNAVYDEYADFFNGLYTAPVQA